MTAPQGTAARLIQDAEGYVELAPRDTKPDEVWMAFEAPFEVRPSRQGSLARARLRTTCR